METNYAEVHNRSKCILELLIVSHSTNHKSCLVPSRYNINIPIHFQYRLAGNKVLHFGFEMPSHVSIVSKDCTSPSIARFYSSHESDFISTFKYGLSTSGLSLAVHTCRFGALRTLSGYLGVDHLGNSPKLLMSIQGLMRFFVSMRWNIHCISAELRRIIHIHEDLIFSTHHVPIP